MTSADGFIPEPDQAELAQVAKWMAENMRYPDVTTAENLVVLRAAPYTMSGPLPYPVRDEVITGPEGDDLHLRIIRPEGEIKAVLVDIHGGGWSTGSAADHDWLNGRFAARCQIATVSVDYRLAPEHPYPAAAEDCVTAALWTARNAAAEFGTTKLLLHGASAGAHLCVETLLRLRDRDPEAFSQFQALSLDYGLYDIGRTPSHRHANADTLVLPDHWLRGFLDNTFPGLTDEERRDPSVSPLYADLTGLPPALFSVGTLDPLLDDSLFMSARWQAAGNHADLDVWPGAMHGFANLAAAPNTTEVVTRRISSWFTARLDA